MLWGNSLNFILRFPVLFKREFLVFKRFSIWAQFSCSISEPFGSRDKITLKVKGVYISVYLGQRLFGTLPILCFAGSKCIYPSEYFLNQSVKLLRQILWLKIKWCPSRKFAHEMNFKIFLVFSTIELKDKVNYFMKEFLEIFTRLVSLLL